MLHKETVIKSRLFGLEIFIEILYTKIEKLQ